MKALLSTFFLLMAYLSFAQNLPVITASPTNITVSPGSTATFSVTASGATGWQWRFNGTNIADATNATLSVANAQSTNSGYYSVLVKNAIGWGPSQMAYLSVISSNGIVPFFNVGNPDAKVFDICNGFGVSNGIVQVTAGPELDQMQPLGQPLSYKANPIGKYFNNGFFTNFDQLVPTAAPGQAVYYQVKVSYTNTCTGPGGFIAFSTPLKLITGGNSFPVPSAAGYFFPTYPEWPNNPDVYKPWYPSTNQIRVPGETFSMTIYLVPNIEPVTLVQWRKNGANIAGATNLSFANPVYYSTLSLTNLQIADAGVYDAVVFGRNWLIPPKIYISIQTTNGQGVLQKPKLIGTNIICDLVGAVGRNYKVQWSTNLTSWNDLTTLSNITGTVTFTNTPGTDKSRFYRTILQPQ